MRGWGFWLGLGFFALVCLGFMAGGLALWHTMQDQGKLPVESIEVKGEHPHTSAAQIRAALNQKPLGSFFTVDVNQVQQRLEALPWIYQAAVRKAWPRKLQLFLVEQHPVAVWNDKALLNDQGQVFKAAMGEAEQQLVHLYGDDDNAAEVLAGYQGLATLLEGSGYQLAAAWCSDRNSWDLQLKDGLKIVLGREDTLRRVQRFIDSFPFLKGEQRQPAYLDMRYDTGFAVGWQEEEKKEKP
ncbi:FtsQ-type POTRA domain-containing protein [Gallaecimonas kandeliae]|uniref:cell division protein FtsQ/DivIB n=1 Tax=Gallaecimonas kandeliae TaxID=3029055 RepID=UPI002649002D|nr:cell division protein FtsQ/DivIB [Gallaecimonas kandeliae]WKE66088.1 FtsQ-type POTRA domain-containing protein [Gallaecimonas kandeliae]